MSNWDQWNNKNDDQSYGQQGYGHPGHAQQGYDQQGQQGYGDYAGAQAMSEGYAHSMFAADAAKSDRMAFIQKTYLHLGGAALAFVILAALSVNVIVPMIGINNVIGFMFGPVGWLVVFGLFWVASAVAQSWATSSNSQGMQYAGLGLYVLAEAIIFTPLLAWAAYKYPGAIETAGVVTLVIFGTLTAFVFITKADFSFLGPMLAIGSMAVFAVIITTLFIGDGGFFLWIAGGIVLLLCGYILYQTSGVLHTYRTDQHVAASLALFSSLATLFWYILQIVMSMRD